LLHQETKYRNWMASISNISLPGLRRPRAILPVPFNPPAPKCPRDCRARTTPSEQHVSPHSQRGRSGLSQYIYKPNHSSIWL
jgi:hypothetical protein